MKKLLAIILALLMLLSLVSCGNVQEEAEVTDPHIVTEDIEAEEMVIEDEMATDEEMVIEEEEVATESESFFTPINPVAEETDNKILGWTDEFDDMPYPFGEFHEGDPEYYFFATTDYKLTRMYSLFYNYVGKNQYVAWIDEYSNSNCEYTSIGEFCNVYSCIKYFEIPDEDVWEILTNARGGYDSDFTDEEIELLLSGDDEAVAEYFVADGVLRKGEDIYSLCWFYNHSIEDYEECGITASNVLYIMPFVEKSQPLEEAKEAFYTKLYDYLESKGALRIGGDEIKELVGENIAIKKLLKIGCLYASFDDLVEIGDKAYAAVIDARYDTWDEWESYIRNCYVDELADKYLDNEHIINIDGFTYCCDGAINYTWTDDYTYEILTNENGVATVRVSNPSVWDDDEPQVYVLTFTMGYDHWRISGIEYE